MKTSNLSADNFKKILDLDGSTPEPAIWSVILVSRYPVLTAVIDVKYMCEISVFLCSQTRQKVRIEHGLPCGADGQVADGRAADGRMDDCGTKKRMRIKKADHKNTGSLDLKEQSSN